MDKITGILTLSQTLDYETEQLYQIKVEVHDNGIPSLSDTCLINIYVIDQNDHAPSIKMKFNPLFEQNLIGRISNWRNLQLAQ